MAKRATGVLQRGSGWEIVRERTMNTVGGTLNRLTLLPVSRYQANRARRPGGRGRSVLWKLESRNSKARVG